MLYRASPHPVIRKPRTSHESASHWITSKHSTRSRKSRKMRLTTLTTMQLRITSTSVTLCTVQTRSQINFSRAKHVIIKSQGRDTFSVVSVTTRATLVRNAKNVRQLAKLGPIRTSGQNWNCLNKTERQILSWQIFVLSAVSALKFSKRANSVNMISLFLCFAMALVFLVAALVRIRHCCSLAQLHENCFVGLKLAWRPEKHAIAVAWPSCMKIVELIVVWWNVPASYRVCLLIG